MNPVFFPKYYLLALGFAVGALNLGSSRSQAAGCESLLGKDFENAHVIETDEVTSPTSIQSSDGFTPGGAVTVRAPFCRVYGVIKPSGDSDIRVEMWLPPAATWNGKYQGVGNGGFAGIVVYRPMAWALEAGYAVASTDTGHAAEMNDARWAIAHPEKVNDLGWRAVHETALASKALIGAYYGRSPVHSYFTGCSTGGREGLIEAQRFPTDYDGIVAGAPANKAAGGKLLHYHGWNDPGIPARASILYYNSVVERMGGAINVDAFYRLFMATGMRHCGSGPGPNAVGGAFALPSPSRDPEHDLIAAMAHWVEDGVAPSQITATLYNNNDPEKGVASQRSWCAYPAVAHYNGKGDRTRASSFNCAITAK
jgi:hypothetical protein